MGLIGTIAFASVAQTPTTLPSQAEELQMIGHNSLVAPRMPLYDTKMASLAILTAEWDKDEIQQVLREIGQNREIIEKLIKCESRGIANKCIIDTNGKLSCGILQFQEATFLGFCKGEWLNPIDQIKCANNMINQRIGPKHWYNCWKNVSN